MCNPYISRVEKAKSNSLHSKGNEDEAPEEEGNQLVLVLEAAEERLQILTNLRKYLEASRKPRSLIDREMRNESKQATSDILNFAHAAKIRAGKVSHITHRLCLFGSTLTFLLLVDAVLSAL